MTASEFMAQLEKDEDYQRRMAEFDAALQERGRQWREAEQPIVADLRRVGVDVASVWDLVNTSEPYPAALPVLVEHLERGGYPDRVLEGAARALAVKPAAVYWERLRDLYLRATGPDAADGLAVALAETTTPEHFDGLLALVNDESRGPSRILFIHTLLKVGGERGWQAVEALRDHPVLGKEATALLSRRKKPRSPRR